jgi:uncharacterized protein
VVNVSEASPAASVVLPTLPAVVNGKVRHRRLSPMRHDVGFRTYLWLVDLDHVPRGTVRASFRPADHLGADGSRSIKANLLRFVRAQGGSTLPGDRFVMLAGARSWGHAFNPLTVYWCLTPGGQIRWSVLEVHNTYGERHAYLITPDAGRRTCVAKEFYVSPFFTVSGRYLVRLRLDAENIAVAITLQQDGQTVFSAGFDGHPVPADRGARLRAALRTPLVMHQTSARIRLHGIWLWLRSVPVVPRPAHSPPRGLS